MKQNKINKRWQNFNYKLKTSILTQINSRFGIASIIGKILVVDVSLYRGQESKNI